jgi:EAL domain-containing protein (putative c-di-GMP-specific phosphodiesterase class I)
MGVGQIIAEKLALKLIEAIEPPVQIGNHTLKVGASIGIAIYPQDGHNAELIMQRADVAMYSSKRNNLMISCYHEDMDGDSYENLVLASDMKNAIQEGQFFALFQPKVNLSTNKPCGCEILLRWRHPQFGLISPDKFIPLAEQQNLTGVLAQQVVDKYFTSLNAVIDNEMDFHFSINVSPHDLLDNLLFNTISNIVKLSQFPASRLYIEVTENAIMKNPLRSADILNRFNDAGIRVSVDDFGTGYSSLAYLQKFPISELKIDKSFIINLTRESNNFPIVNATITMAHDLGICVVAEGVEDRAATLLLKELGCDRAQGYYFGQPLDYDEFVEWIKSWNEK